MNKSRWVGGGGNPTSLEGSQVSPARPSGNSSTKTKMCEEERAVTVEV
jgi:hypothetical protein